MIPTEYLKTFSAEVGAVVQKFLDENFSAVKIFATEVTRQGSKYRRVTYPDTTEDFYKEFYAILYTTLLNEQDRTLTADEIILEMFNYSMSWSNSYQDIDWSEVDTAWRKFVESNENISEKTILKNIMEYADTISEVL